METNNQNTENPGLGMTHISEFNRVDSKCAQTIDLDTFVRKLTSDEFKERTLQYRTLSTQPALKEQAQKIKRSMPCAIPAAVCMGGHAVSHIRHMSGLLCIDFDHTDQRTEEVKRQASELPWVALAFISISGKGVKVWVHISLQEANLGYASLYKAVGEALSQHVNHPYDTQCKALTQPCYYSYDPQAYYNPQAEEFHQPEVPVTCSPRAARLLQQFEEENPFVEGQRNNVCLKLGRRLRCQFFSEEEAELVIRIYAARHAMNDFSEREIQKRVVAGYQYIKEKEEDCPLPVRVHQGSGLTYEPSPHNEKAEEEADVLEKNNELRARTPCIRDEVYPTLPGFLQRCVHHARSPRERDVLLLGSLLSCSAALPHVSFFYRNQYCSPHFYLAVVAPAGTGKGVLAFTNSLVDSIDDYYEGERMRLNHRYEEELQTWELEQQQARKEKRKANLTLKPEPPRLPLFKLSATTSKSRLIESLVSSGDIGCCMTSTEIVTLSNAFRTDYGGFEDILLKAFQHEEVSYSYCKENAPQVARHPKLSLCLSGTQEQFLGLFRSLESGLYSRFAFYTLPGTTEWMDCSPHSGEVDLRSYFRNLGDELLEMHKLLLESPTIVSFSQAQWEEHTRFFSNKLKQTAVEGQESTAGIIYRSGLQAMRMAATLTVFRKWDDYRYAREYNCTDEDFHTALHLVDTLLEHSLLLSTSLPGSRQAPVPMHNFYKIEEILKQLPDTFTYSDFVALAQENGYSLTTCKRMLKRSLTHQLLVKVNGNYQKTTFGHPKE